MKRRNTNPRSLNDLSCVFVKRLGSPVPSAATASNSSNGGATNKSRKFNGRDFRVPVPEPPDDKGFGKTRG